MQSWDLITPTPPVKHKSVMGVKEGGGALKWIRFKLWPVHCVV